MIDLHIFAHFSNDKAKAKELETMKQTDKISLSMHDLVF